MVGLSCLVLHARTVGAAHVRCHSRATGCMFNGMKCACAGSGRIAANSDLVITAAFPILTACSVSGGPHVRCAQRLPRPGPRVRWTEGSALGATGHSAHHHHAVQPRYAGAQRRSAPDPRWPANHAATRPVVALSTHRRRLSGLAISGLVPDYFSQSPAAVPCGLFHGAGFLYDRGFGRASAEDTDP